MNLRTLFWLSVITGCLMAPIAQGQSVITLDGFYDAGNVHEVNAYSNIASVDWTNGHGTTNDYWYDGSGASTIQTTIRYGSGTLSGDSSGNIYYFLYVEAPIEIKGMSWSKDSDKLADYHQYVLGGGYIHQESDGSLDLDHIKKMDYKTATGSEKVEFGSYVGNFEEEGLLTGDIDGSGAGLIGLADSIDYLLANDDLLKAAGGSAYDGDLENSTSVNPNIPMAFEFQFQTQQNLDAAVTAASAGIILHLSPSKVPEPSSLLLLGIASVGTLLRRKR
jgi:hypothetical protein